CLLMAEQAELAGDYDLVFPILNHENEEAFCGDMNTMLKNLCPDFKAHSKRIGSVMNKRMGVPDLTDAQRTKIKEYDLKMMATERQQLVKSWRGERWELLDGIE